ncbi:MAG: hypothetical protein JXB60_09940 [Candidatus Cloacimonetes bacterium]|nr:hypothetical protein [Candidatus Cloacimonadota bacterium]
MENNELVHHFFLQPFFIGLYIGFFVVVILFFKSLADRRKLYREIKNLRKHLQTKLDIEAEAHEKKKSDLEDLKEINANLRITVQNMVTKPGRRELRQLYIYQQALELMTERAPGFAQAWQAALKESELNYQQAEKGLKPFLRKLISPSRIFEIPERKE